MYLYVYFPKCQQQSLAVHIIITHQRILTSTDYIKVCGHTLPSILQYVDRRYPLCYSMWTNVTLYIAVCGHTLLSILQYVDTCYPLLQYVDTLYPLYYSMWTHVTPYITVCGHTLPSGRQISPDTVG
jgi:hypothetical protein